MAMPWKLCNTWVNCCCKISIDYWVEKKMLCVFRERYGWIVVGRNLICVLLPSEGGGGVGGRVLPHMTYKGLWRGTEYGFLPLCPKQGIYWISCESVVARIYDFRESVEMVYSARSIWFHRWILYTKAMTITWICSVAIANKWHGFKTRRRAFSSLS